MMTAFLGAIRLALFRRRPADQPAAEATPDAEARREPAEQAEAAAFILPALPDRESSNSNWFNLIGRAHTQAGDLPAAIAFFGRAASLAPYNHEHALCLANAVFAAGLYEYAAPGYQRAIELYPPDELSPRMLIEALSRIPPRP